MNKGASTLTITKIKIAFKCQFTVFVLIKKPDFSIYLKSVKKLTKSEEKNLFIFLCATKLFTSKNQTMQFYTIKYTKKFIYYNIQYIIRNIKIYYLYLFYNIKIIKLFLPILTFKKRCITFRPKIPSNVIHLFVGGRHKCHLHS